MSGLEPGFELGHYRILRSLGSGGMADVYEAHDEHLDRTVALKILPIEYCRNPQLVARFQKEVRAAARLNHRNIVTVFEVGQQESFHYFSMRLLVGGDLRRRIEQGLPPVEALAILREVADAFAHAHARGFVHRDVKPENIMFDEQGFPVLTDFGIAKALDSETRMTRTGMTMGTPRYLSPEQASGKPVDARADLYSLGVILYEMLTGRPPYDAEESMAVIYKHVTEPIPQLPADFARYQPLLEKLMAKDPAQRLASAEELIRTIDLLAPDIVPRERPPSQIRTAESPLIKGLMTPSPLRTSPPKTPRPVTTGPDLRAESGEVAVAAARTTREAAGRAQPVPVAASVASAAPAAQAPATVTTGVTLALSRRQLWAGGVVVAAAALGAGAWALRTPPAPPAAPVTPAPVITSAPAPTPAPAPARAPAPTPASKADTAALQRAAAERAEGRRRERAYQEKLREQEAARQAKELAVQQKREDQARQLKVEQTEKQAAIDAKAKKRAEAVARKQAAVEAKAKKRAEAVAKKQAAIEAKKKKAEEEKANQPEEESQPYVSRPQQ